MFVSGVSSKYNYIMHYLNFVLSCPIKNLIITSVSRLFTIKSDVIQFPFLQILFQCCFFFRESNYLKSVAQFSIEQETFLQNMLFTQLHIMKGYNHRRSSDRIWAQDGKLFRQKVVISLLFSLMIMNFFSLTQLISFIDSLHQKIAEA